VTSRPWCEHGVDRCLDCDAKTRPPNVPADWVLVWCEAGCGASVWVPPVLPPGTQRVHSMECALAAAARLAAAGMRSAIIDGRNE
jgi:hypothetical protein